MEIPKDKKVIIIEGIAGSGKTTIARKLQECKKNVILYSFAEPLKRIALNFGFEEKQLFGSCMIKKKKISIGG